MRWAVPAGVAAAVLGAGIALFAAGGDDDEAPPDTGTQPGFTVTDDVDLDELPPATQPAPPKQRAAVERAVIAYIEAAERGEIGQQGLPTSDELSIERVRIRGNRATVRLAGGTRIRLRKNGNWQVSGASVPDIEPTPPSGPP